MTTTIFANGERNQATPFIFRDLKYKFFSFYSNNLKPEISQKQSEVFEKLEIPLTQIVSSDLTTTGQFSWRDHELHLDYLLHTEDADIYCFFDIDCIPLRKDFLDYVHDYIKDGNTILGTAQVSAHIDRSHIYCAPSCLFLHKDVLNKLGWPSFMSNHRSDVGQEITRIAESKNVQVLYWFPSE